MIGFAAPVVIIKLPAPVSESVHRSFPVSQHPSWELADGQAEQVDKDGVRGVRWRK